MRSFVAAIVALSVFAGAALAQTKRGVDIWSEGTRMAGDLWLPSGLGPDETRPALLLSHGWGGLRSHLNNAYADSFARAGFIVLTFDYRGWGGSDSRLILAGREPPAEADGTATARVRLIREVVDPRDQMLDLAAAFAWLAGEPQVDTARIGLWGTSYSGGHVIAYAARDARVAAVVAQVGYMGVAKNPSGLGPLRATQKARGEIDPVPQGIDEIAGLRGTPDLAKMVGWRPLDEAHKVRAPTLVIDVANEELFDRTANGRAVCEIISRGGVCEYQLFAGRHYDIYGSLLGAAVTRAIDWFTQHLMRSAP